jgi:hypothetical protein
VVQALADVLERAARIEGVRARHEIVEAVELVGRGDEVADVLDAAALHLGCDVDDDERRTSSGRRAANVKATRPPIESATRIAGAACVAARKRSTSTFCVARR